MIRRVILLLCCVLSAGAAAAAPRDDLLAADRAFAKLAATKGWGYAVLAMATNDARLTAPGGEAFYGRAQALRSLARPAPGALSWAPETATVSADGRLGWTDGRWLRTAKDAKAGGRYLSVWVRGSGGAWKLQASVSATTPKK